MRDLIPGGKSDKIPPSRFPSKKVQEGARVESEHTSNPQMAREIARDHLTEDMGYYGKLKKMEKKAGLLRMHRIADSINRKNIGVMKTMATRFGDKVPSMAEIGDIWKSQGEKLKPLTEAVTSAGNKYGRRLAKLEKKGEWDQGTLQMPERSFEPKVPNQDPWNRKSKMKKADAFFDELTKISFEVSGKGALIGAGIGAGVGGVSALRRELKERSWDNRMQLSDDEKKAMRKLRRKGHLGRVLLGTSAGAVMGGGYKALGDAAGAVAKTVRHNVQPEVDKVVTDIASQVKSHAGEVGNIAGSAAGTAAADAAATGAKKHFKMPDVKDVAKGVKDFVFRKK